MRLFAASVFLGVALLGCRNAPRWATVRSGATYDDATGLPARVADKQTGIQMRLVLPRAGGPFYVSEDVVPRSLWARENEEADSGLSWSTIQPFLTTHQFELPSVSQLEQASQSGELDVAQEWEFCSDIDQPTAQVPVQHVAVMNLDEGGQMRAFLGPDERVSDWPMRTAGAGFRVVRDP